MSMRKKVLFVLLAMAVCLGICPVNAYAEEEKHIEFTPEEEAFIASEKEVVIGDICIYPYYRQKKDGEGEGIFQDIVEMIEEESGLNIQLCPMAEGEYTKTVLDTGEYDVVVGIERNAYERQEEYIVSDSLITSKIVPVVQKDNLMIDFEKDTIKAAIPKTFLALKSYLTENYPNITIVEYVDNKSCMEAVRKGEVDTFLQDTYVTSYIIQSPYFSSLQLLPVGIMTVDRSMVALDTADNRILMSILNKCIEKIQEPAKQAVIVNNTYAKQYNYSLSEFAYKYYLVLSIITCLFLALIVAVSLTWFVKTKSEEKLKRMNKDLQQAVKLAEDANEEKTNFLSRMSHDIRTPLNAIMGMASLAQERSVNPEVKGYLKQILDSSEYLLELINDILDVGRIESGKIELKENYINVDDIFKSVMTIMSAYHVEKNINLVVDRQASKFTYVKTDPVRWQQVFVNLLSNAYKFSDNNGTVELKVFDKMLDGGRVEKTIVVTDYGCGMSPEFQQKLFSPFEQEKNKFSGKYSGSGLGLTISKRIIEAMGGTIEVESIQGQGTTFTIHVILKIGKSLEEGNGELERKYTKDSFKGKRLLLVEDNEINREIAVLILEAVGFEVDCAINGAEAVDSFEKNVSGYYNEILMDLRMPVMGGIEATKHIRESQKEDAGIIPIIAMTADAFQDDVLKTKEAGMTAHLAKPIKKEEVYNTLYEILL